VSVLPALTVNSPPFSIFSVTCAGTVKSLVVIGLVMRMIFPVAPARLETPAGMAGDMASDLAEMASDEKAIHDEQTNTAKV